MHCNIFNKDFKSKVLVSYITRAFHKNSNVWNHTNINEMRIICLIFDKIGYSVDIVDYDSNEAIDYTGYDVVFGFGYPFEKSFSCRALKIFYGTGACSVYQNHAEINRIIQVNNKYNSNLQPARLFSNS